MSYNKYLIGRELYELMTLKLRYLANQDRENALRHSLDTEYRVKLEPGGQEITMLEPTALLQVSKGNVKKVVSINGETFTSQHEINKDL